MEVIEAHDCIAECFRDARANFQVGLNASERLLDLAQQAVPEMEEIDDPSSRGHFIVMGALRWPRMLPANRSPVSSICYVSGSR
jgi:hypothetical protein